MTKQTAIAFIAGLFLLTACAKKKHDVVVSDPSQATLIFPAKNSACTTGTLMSATESSITFTWNNSLGTDSYELNIKNLVTGTTAIYTSTTNQLLVNLSRNTPFAWSVTSKSNRSAATAQSETWKFYNAGPGTTSHPPFPADNLSPSFGQTLPATTGAVNLAWASSDPDNDITSYDVYFGTSETPGIYKSAVTDKFLINVPISPGTTYYWKIVTKDQQGNTSESENYQFTTN